MSRALSLPERLATCRPVADARDMSTAWRSRALRERVQVRADLGTLATSPVRLLRRMRRRCCAVAAPPEVLHRCLRILQARLVLLETSQEGGMIPRRFIWLHSRVWAQCWNRVLTSEQAGSETSSAHHQSGPVTTSVREGPSLPHRCLLPGWGSHLSHHPHSPP